MKLSTAWVFADKFYMPTEPAYRDNWDRIFRPNQEHECHAEAVDVEGGVTLTCVVCGKQFDYEAKSES